MGILRRTRWNTCRGLQFVVGKRALEFWYLPPNTYVDPHHHDFDGLFFKLFGKAIINKEQITKSWDWFDFHLYKIRAGQRHWLRCGPWPLFFVNFQKHKSTVESAGENFIK